MQCRKDFVDNQLRILGTRIIGGNNDVVSQLQRQRTHQRTLFVVAVTAAAEHNPQLAAGNGACGFQHVLQAVWSMCVVYNNSIRLSCLNELETSGDAVKAVKHGADNILVNLFSKHCTDNAHNIIHVELAGNLQLQVHFAHRSMQQELHMLRFYRKAQRIDVIIMSFAIGQHVSLGTFTDNCGARVIHIKNSVFIRLAAISQMLEEQALGIAVILHSFMEVQVILGNIRQHSAVIFNACHTLQRQSMAGNFHYAVVTAGTAHSIQCLLQVNYIRSSIMRFGNLIVNHNIDSADQANLVACLAQNQANNIRRGGFAVSTGHADHSQLAPRIIIKIRCYQLHSLTRIGNLNKSNTLRHCSRNILYQRSNSALFGSHRQEFMSVYSCTLQADKKTAGYHRTGIGSYISNNFISTANDLSLRQ